MFTMAELLLPKILPEILLKNLLHKICGNFFSIMKTKNIRQFFGYKNALKIQ